MGNLFVDDPGGAASSDSCGAGALTAASESDSGPRVRTKVLKRRGRRSVQRKGLKLDMMPNTWQNDVGPNFSVPKETELVPEFDPVTSDADTTAGPDSPSPHITDDDDWDDGSEQIVACACRLRDMFEAEANTDRARPEKTQWSFDNTDQRVKHPTVYEPRRRAARDHQRLMSQLLPKKQLPGHRQKISPPLFLFRACVARPVGKAETSREPEARKALRKGVG